MSQNIQAPETDLIVPLPGEGERWDPYTIHTHFFNFAVPERALSVFCYIRYLPAFGASQGGVLAYTGLDNITTADMAHHDYQMSMPWPTIEGNRFTTANGLSFDFTEPGRTAHLTYTSEDGNTSFDVVAEAISPLAARGHVMPGEEKHRTQQPGGSEQFMHTTGELILNGERIDIDSNSMRDRSWRQVRTEALSANSHPPIMWTPVYFDEHFAFNQVGFAHPDTKPVWGAAFDIPRDAPTHHFAWVSRDGEVRNVTRVYRNDLELHPILLAPTVTEIEAEDDRGEVYRLRGEAIACAPLPSWPNLASFETLFRWEDNEGRVAHGVGQSVWNSRAQQAMKSHRGWKV